jgi:CxxC motif-containing protein (DUF1111 family)
MFAVAMVGGSVVAVIVLSIQWRIRGWERAWEEAHSPEMVQAGRELFHHEWTPGDPLSPNGDGLGPVFNATSCVACHNQGGSGGGGERKHNVTSFVVNERPGKVREGVLHAKATRGEFQERLAVISGVPALSHDELVQRMFPDVDEQGRIENAEKLAVVMMERIGRPSNVVVSQVNTPALFGSGLIDSIPDRVLTEMEESQRVKFHFPTKGDNMPVGRVSRLANGRIGKFGWKGQTASLSDFVQAACANELGLGNPNHPQPRPLDKPNYEAPGLDLTQQQCDQLTAYVASLDRPTERIPSGIHGNLDAANGKQVFGKIGCADCHSPKLGEIEGIYSDLLLHRMGDDSAGGAGYRGETPPPDIASNKDGGPDPREWRTPPLWGVADSAPYMHDGRARTLDDAIKMHGGQGGQALLSYMQLAQKERDSLLAFLGTLRAPGSR